MPSRRGKTVHHTGALILGLSATAVAVLAHLAGLGERMELYCLDLRLQHVSMAPVNPDIIHIDIDDRSLDEFGRWPWNRRQDSGLIETLQQCGARQVVLDIIMPEPQETRYVSAFTNIYKADFAEILGDASPSPIFDDAHLAATLRRYSDTCLAMYIDLKPEPLGRRETRALTILTTRPEATPAEVADALNVSKVEMSEPWRQAFKHVLDEKVEAAVWQHPRFSLLDVRKQILPHLPLEEVGFEADFIRRAYLRSRAMTSLSRLALPASVLQGYPARSGKITPPLVTFADSMHYTGFVTFQPEIDGVLRRIPMLVRSGNDVFPQLSLAVALRELQRTSDKPPAIRADAGCVHVDFPGGASRDIPTDSDGAMIIRWADREESYRKHIPAADVLDVWKKRKVIEDHKSAYRLACLKLAQVLKQEDILALAKKADDLNAQEIDAEIKWQQEALFSPATAKAAPAHLAEQEEQIDAQLEDKLQAFMDKENLNFYKQSGTPQQVKEIQHLEDLARTQYAAHGIAKEELGNLMAKVRQHVEGKICLVGSTATGAADFVPTPIGPREPGVVVHANILNTILQGSFVRQLPLWTDILAIMLAGLAATLLTAYRPVLQAGPFVAVAAAAYAAFNAYVVFGLWSGWLSVSMPLAAMLASFMVVTAYRQLTEERAKRHVKAMLAHTLSPALVERVLEDPSLLKLGGEKRVLTCFFSDIAHFTPLSKRLGEQQTVTLLNRYFDRMMEILQNRRGAYLSKFLGDGIFVFFGAPVFLEDHPSRALQAAVECRDDVVLFNELLAEDFPAKVHLDCRVGIATGEAMVGNCGSTEKIDYTAIGDTVNLSSRLEGVNKFFGTEIIAAEETWRLGAGEKMLGRRLGSVYVVGRNESVGIWNVMNFIDQASPRERQLAEDFTAAIELYRRQDFRTACDLLDRILQTSPADKAALFYRDLCGRLADNPPPPDWDDAIHLTEK